MNPDQVPSIVRTTGFTFWKTHYIKLYHPTSYGIVLIIPRNPIKRALCNLSWYSHFATPREAKKYGNPPIIGIGQKMYFQQKRGNFPA